MPPTLETLPEELVGIIIKQVTTRALTQLSLVSHKWHKAVYPELFSALTLSSRTSAGIAELYEDLFDESSAVGGVSLSREHIQGIDYSFSESDTDQGELRHKLAASSRVLNALRSVSVLELGLSLSDESSDSFGTILLPAIKSFFDDIRTKVKSIDMSIDVAASMSFLEESDDASHEELTMKMTRICDLVPTQLVTSICFVGVELDSMPPPLERLLNSTALKEVSIQDCNKSFNCLPQIPNLDDLSISWGGLGQETCAMKAAFDICQNSAPTLKSLRLQNVLPRDVPVPGGWSTMLPLPVLTRLQISDSHSGIGSLFDTLISHTSLPKLSTLVLELEDLFDMATHVNQTLEQKLGNLRRLAFVGSGSRRDPEVGTPDAAAYYRLEETCREKGIHLEVSVSARCATAFELAYEAMRLEILASHLIYISLRCHSAVKSGIKNLPYMHFPIVRRLLLGFSGSMTSPAADSSAQNDKDAEEEAPVLKSLFDHFRCPSLAVLQPTVFINDQTGSKNLAELEDTIKDGTYPCLERLAGAVMAPPGMPAKNLEALKEVITLACEARDIDCTGLNFISRDDLGGDEEVDEGNDHPDVSEASEVRSSQEEDEGDSIILIDDSDNEETSINAESDSGESGYAESTTLLQCLDKASSDSNSEDPDYVPNDKSSGSSSTSEDSWLTDENEILDAFTRSAR